MKSNGYYVLFLSSIFLGVILFLNWTYTFSGDDCFYALDFGASGDGVRHRLGGFLNAWRANWADGYRPVVHLFVRMFTGCFDKWVFNLANTAMMGCLLALSYFFSKRTFRIEYRSLVLLMFLVFFVLCKGESYLYCAGSLNYLWAGTGTLLFCIATRNVYEKNVTWRYALACVPIALFAGWLQEAFALPVFCALLAYNVFQWRCMTAKRLLMLVFYLIGVILLVRIAGQRASSISHFSLTAFAVNALKIAVAIKAVWILLFVFAFRWDKMAFVSRNVFSLLVIGSSIAMILIVGFNGERSLWAANLFSIIVIVREVDLSKIMTCVISAVLLITMGICCFFGYRIKSEFDSATKMYLSSDNGLCWHNRVACGPFARFFHQILLTWENCCDNEYFGNFCGRGVAPAALSKSDYDKLVNNIMCVPENRLGTKSEAYTTLSSNTIIMPLCDTDPHPASVRVEYAFPSGFLNVLKRELAIRRNPPVPHENTPREIFAGGRRYALVSKIPWSDVYIKDVTLGYSKEKERGLR